MRFYLCDVKICKCKHTCLDKHVYVTTKHIFCCDKSMLVAAKPLLRQNYVCCDKTFVVRNTCFWRSSQMHGPSEVYSPCERGVRGGGSSQCCGKLAHTHTCIRCIISLPTLWERCWRGRRWHCCCDWCPAAAQSSPQNWWCSPGAANTPTGRKQQVTHRF